MSLPASATTQLIFNVDANIYGYNSDTSINNATPLGSSQYQLKVVIDETQFDTSSGVQPPFESIFSAVEQVSMPVMSVSGESADAINAVAAAANVSRATSGQAMYGEAASDGTIVEPYIQAMQVSNGRSESQTVGDVYDVNGYPGQQMGTYSENLSISYLTYDAITPSPQTVDDFFAAANSLLGASDAFNFSHKAIYYIEECDLTNDLCLYRDLFLDPLSVEGVVYSGTATLVGISNVPIPASGWLFASSLLLLLRRRRG